MLASRVGRSVDNQLINQSQCGGRSFVVNMFVINIDSRHRGGHCRNDHHRSVGNRDHSNRNDRHRNAWNHGGRNRGRHTPNNRRHMVEVEGHNRSR